MQQLYSFGVSTAGDLAGTRISPRHLPSQTGVQAQQPWALEIAIVPERLIWAEVHNASSLWAEVTILQSHLQSQARVRHGVLGTKALRQAVQGPLEEQERWKYQICALEGIRITKVVAGGPRVKGLSPGAMFGGAAKGNTVPPKPGAGTGLSPNTDGTTKVQCYQGPSARAAERQLLREESEILEEEVKLRWVQLSQCRELLLKQMTDRQQAEACSWKLPNGQEGKGYPLEAARTDVQDAGLEHSLLRISVHVLQSKLSLAATVTVSLSSSSSEVSFSDRDISWGLLKEARYPEAHSF